MAMQEMTAQELNDLILEEKEDLFLFDVRNEDDFADWKIEGNNIEYLNIPYFEIMDGVDDVIPKIPSNKRVVVVCAKEGSSKFVAEMLSDQGMDVSYLKGGMRAWSEYLHKVKVYGDENMDVYQLIRVGKGCLSYIVVSDGEMLVVDPLRFVDEYKQFAKDNNLKITHIVDSHLHADHLSGGHELAQDTGANYYIMKSEGAVFDFYPLEDYNEINFANVNLQVLAVKTPGHTPGSVSFFVNNKVLFSGDTIFVSGLGRPDLGGKVREWAQDLYDTVYNKVTDIADDVLVLPAHYADIKTELNEDGYIGTDLGTIRKQNEAMFNTSKEEFLDQVEKSASDVKPPNFEEIIAINRGEQDVTLERQEELEIGPNRCAVHHTA